MADKTLTEEDFTEAAEKALGGDLKGATSLVAGVLSGAALGSPLAGVVVKKGVDTFARALTDTATARMQAAGKQYDSERSRNRALARELRASIEPLFAVPLDDIAAAGSEQFLQTILYMERNLATDDGQKELLREVHELRTRLQERDVRALHNDLAACSLVKTPESGARVVGLIKQLKLMDAPVPELTGVVFSGIDLVQAGSAVDFSACTLRDADFSRAKLRMVVFDKANLHRTTFEHADLPMASFHGGKLRSCRFRSANALFCDFSQADLTSARFEGGILGGAKFTDSDLCDVNFDGANLNGATFTGAKNLTSEQLGAAKTLFLARGLPEALKARLKDRNPGLFREPEADELFVTSGPAEGGKLTTTLFKLVARMSVDEFERFLAMSPPDVRLGMLNLRKQLREGASLEVGADVFFETLAEEVKKRMDLIGRRITISFAVVDEGAAYHLDTSDPKLISRKYVSNADVSIQCNRKTLSDILFGRFDANSPDAAHLFLWDGDREVFRMLGDVLGMASPQPP